MAFPIALERDVAGKVLRYALQLVALNATRPKTCAALWLYRREAYVRVSSVPLSQIRFLG